MSLLNDLGVQGNVPSINITSFVSNTWIWVLVVVIIGFLLITGVGIILFFTTYKRKVEIYESIGSQPYRTIVTRARFVKFGQDGGEVMKTLRGGHYLTAYGKKISRNSYPFYKGSDGYLYNFVLTDLDSKKEAMDIEPVDTGVRMFHEALNRASINAYGKTTFMEKYGNYILAFIFLGILIFGGWVLIGRIGEATAPLAQSQELSIKVQESNLQITSKLEGIINNLNRLNYPSSGIVPVNVTVNQT